MDKSEFEYSLSEIQGLRIEDCSLDQGRETLKRGEAIAYLINEHGPRLLISERESQSATLDLLLELVAIYKGKADIFRASNDVWDIQKPYYPDIIALVVFPRLKPDDILNAARNGEKVPSGITRHIVPARALHINIPIGILMADWGIETKRQWLDGWWMERMAANAIRYYAEPTFSFNE